MGCGGGRVSAARSVEIHVRAVGGDGPLRWPLADQCPVCPRSHLADGRHVIVSGRRLPPPAAAGRLEVPTLTGYQSWAAIAADRATVRPPALTP